MYIHNNTTNTFDSVSISSKKGIETIQNMENGETKKIVFYWNECTDCQRVETKMIKDIKKDDLSDYIILDVKKIQAEEKKYLTEHIPTIFLIKNNKHYYETPTIAVIKKNGEKLQVLAKNSTTDIKDIQKVVRLRSE